MSKLKSGDTKKGRRDTCALKRKRKKRYEGQTEKIVRSMAWNDSERLLTIPIEGTFFKGKN